MRTTLIALLLALCACGDEPSDFENECRFGTPGGASYRVSWDEDASGRFVQVEYRSDENQLYSNECTQVDLSNPPACIVHLDDGDVVFAVVGGHLTWDSDVGGGELGRCE